MKCTCLALLLITGATIAADLTFAPYLAEHLPKSELTVIPRGFRLSFSNEEGKDNYAIAIGSTGGLIVPAQHKLVMILRGHAKNKNTSVAVHILTAQDASGKLVTHYSKAVSGDGTADRTLILGLDSDFHLADAQWDLRQIKIHLNGRDNPNGFSALDVRDLRIAAPDARIAFLFPKVGLSGADMGAAADEFRSPDAAVASTPDEAPAEYRELVSDYFKAIGALK